MRGCLGILMVAFLTVVSCDSSGGGDARDLFTPDVPTEAGDPGVDPNSVDVPAEVPADLPTDLLSDLPVDTIAPDVPADLPIDIQMDVPVDVTPITSPCGFDLRAPQIMTVPFAPMFEGDPATTQDMPQTDHVCTFKYGAIEGCFYVQASPEKCEGMKGCTYVTDGFWTSFDDVVAKVDGAIYSWGGNHHNDSVTFTLDGNNFNSYHSTMGFGGRSCQPMDCLQVLGSDMITVQENGCDGLTRTLPIACVIVNPDGTVPPFPTTFERCLGDPNNPPT